MKVQISFDMTDLDNALSIAQKIEPFADVFEVGTLLIYQHGAQAVKVFKENFPTKTILADGKIVDRGKEATGVFVQAQADWITVMAGTNKQVIHSACTTAHQSNVKVMLDLVDASSLGQSAMDAKNMGVDALLFHQAYDEKDALILLDKWEMVRGNTNLPIFVSAKINRTSIGTILSIKPDGIVLGKNITESDDPAAEAEHFYNLAHKKE